MKFIGLGKVSRQLFPIASIAINSILIGAMPSFAAQFQLYDSSSNLLPEIYDSPDYSGPNQKSLAFGAIGSPTRSPATNLNTTSSNAISAGYSNYSLPIQVNSQFPVLDRTLGYTLSFGVQIASQTNISNNRAGFSVIALSSDLQGIELGFWETEIFAQNVGFTHAEGNTSVLGLTSALTNYDLTILNNSYSLSTNGSEILTGSLRNYSPAGFIYNSPNFVFLGDNTTSASANVNFGNISIAVPFEFSPALGLGILISGSILTKRAKRPKRRSTQKS